MEINGPKDIVERGVVALERIALALEHKYLVDQEGVEISKEFIGMIGNIIKMDIPGEPLDGSPPTEDRYPEDDVDE